MELIVFLETPTSFAKSDCDNPFSLRISGRWLSLISGDSACLWCEERPECRLEAKDGGKGLLGCPEWWLRYRSELPVEGGPDAEEKPEHSVLDLAEQ